MIELLAPAKINLGLEILGRRSDGFHEIRTIMVKMSLFDRVSIATARALSIWSDVPGLNDADNLAYRAAQALDRPAAIQVRKRIPAAAGLGGASSDAAAVLRGLSILSPEMIEAEVLTQTAARIGSDVPFFLSDGAALASGRGERCAPLPGEWPYWFVIVTPAINIPEKTSTLYRLLTAADFTTGERVERLARALTYGEMIQSAWLANAFERPLHQNWPAARAIRDALREAGAQVVGLSGAGPAHYAICDDFREASALAAKLRGFVAPTTRIVVCRAVSGAVWRRSTAIINEEASEPAANDN